MKILASAIDGVLSPYGPSAINELLHLLLLSVAAAALAAGSIAVPNLIGPRPPNPRRLYVYEAGNGTLADVTGSRLSVKF